ncbi:MAG TPA: hypothetical protein VJP86_03320 [Vicinamibacterales bacterium]|jgi:hypothetical protein|nr:hypothetical protein [Vicinamibacterales bacterium]
MHRQIVALFIVFVTGVCIAAPVRAQGQDASTETTYHVGGTARGYYINDQRLQFSGQESTFAAEGQFNGRVQQTHGSWRFGLDGEVFLNQPFDRNILQNTPQRQSFLSNFDVEPFQISQLSITSGRGPFSASFGRFVTPFGRFYYPIYRNNFDDSPFIRSEAVLYRETGLLLKLEPKGFSLAAALTNGGAEQDTNSSKALVARAGVQGEHFAIGGSVKTQDGIGSERQKTFKSHFGGDAMVRNANWTLSAEAIHDEYGFRQPGYDPNDIFWGRSLYFRDLNKAPSEPITGFGYYMNADVVWTPLSLTVNYGEFYPDQLGVPEHDVTDRRGFVKVSGHMTPNFDVYLVAMLENSLDDFLFFRGRRGHYGILGFQFSIEK